MILSCKDYLSKNGRETIWSQPRTDIRRRINECLDLRKTYKRSYRHHSEKTRAQRPKDFCISEHYVFGKFNGFCERLVKILIIFDTLDGYETLFATHVCGLLWDESIQEKEKEFSNHVKIMTGKQYNVLDYRLIDFDTDFDDFMEKTEELKLSLNRLIEKNYQSIWETPQAIKFLKRIEEVNKYVKENI